MKPQPEFAGMALARFLSLKEPAVKRVPRHFIDRLGELIATGVPETSLLAYLCLTVATAIGVDFRDALRSDLERIAEEGALVENVRADVSEILVGTTPERWFGSCGDCRAFRTW